MALKPGRVRRIREALQIDSRTVSARYSVDEPYGRLGIVIENWDYTYPGASDGFTILLSGGSEVDRFIATGDISAMTL